MPKGEYSALETELYRHGYESGLTVLPYPPRFRGSCGAVRPRSMVVLPNGDIHKCWHTTGFRERRVGTIFDLESINHDPTMKDWLLWNPFRDGRCRKCKILPNCAGGCGYKSLYPDAGKGEGGRLPCISWKYNINELLVLRAVTMGIISIGDYDPQAICTQECSLQIETEPERAVSLSA
ncbi:MAG: SPASM domain-containing protein [Methanothrix sp.]|nr:SPASM domain-containing protein [Methanothrix sp.]